MRLVLMVIRWLAPASFVVGLGMLIFGRFGFHDLWMTLTGFALTLIGSFVWLVVRED